MEESRGYRVIASFAVGALCASLLVVALTIGGELYAPLKAWLAAVFTHHWIGKSVITAVSLVAVSLLFLPFARPTRKSTLTLLYLALLGAAAGAAALTLFFIFEAVTR